MEGALYTIRCSGTTGKGPHNVNVPEGVLWALISLKPRWLMRDVPELAGFFKTRDQGRVEQEYDE